MDYQGIHNIKPSEVLARHKVMQGVEFTEAPPDDTYYNKDSRRIKCRI